MIHQIKLLKIHHNNHIILDNQLLAYGGTQFAPPIVINNLASESKRIEELRSELKRMKNELQLTQARYGINCPPHILLDIEDIDEYFKTYPEGEDANE